MDQTEEFSQEVNDLKQKYESIITKLDTIEKENSNREKSVEQIENSIEAISINMKALMEKIDLIVEDRETSKMFTSDKKSSFTFMNMMKAPMRRLTISTMRTIFTLADYATEKSAYAREGLEDIVAEAQYESKKKRAAMMPNVQN